MCVPLCHGCLRFLVRTPHRAISTHFPDTVDILARLLHFILLMTSTPTLASAAHPLFSRIDSKGEGWGSEQDMDTCSHMLCTCDWLSGFYNSSLFPLAHRVLISSKSGKTWSSSILVCIFGFVFFKSLKVKNLIFCSPGFPVATPPWGHALPESGALNGGAVTG